MLVFAVSARGGTGRSVTGCNVAYRLALHGRDVCYLDFDFGSSTSRAIFGIEAASHGTSSGSGLHAYFAGHAAEPEQLDIWGRSDRRELRRNPLASGRLVLVPGDRAAGSSRRAMAWPTGARGCSCGSTTSSTSSSST